MGRLSQLRDDLKNKKIRLTEVYDDLIVKIKTRNPQVNAYLEVFEEEMRARTKILETEASEAAPLAGLPIGIKDMISMKNHVVSASSKILEGYRAPRSATVTEKLKKAGAIFTGRLNCDEFAMGSSNENTSFGAVKNPVDLARTAGGSSGGSAAAVAAELCVGSLGTDTGGSIRLPAAFCGIVGMKPTYGRVSRSGVIAFASSLDQVGPFADDALDCAEILQVIAGRDARDSTTMPVPVENYVAAAKNGSLKGLKIGLPKEYFISEGVSPEIVKQTQAAIEVFKKEGATIKEVSIPHTEYGIAVYYLVATAEAASNLSRYDGIRYGKRAKDFASMKDLIIKTRSEGFGAEVKRRIMLGTFSLSSGYYDAYYSKAQYVRSKIQNEFLNALKEVDVLFAPVTTSTAFKIGEKVNDPLAMYLSDIFTVSINLAGVPAIAFPIGHDSKGLPIGGQFIGGPFQEAKLLAATAGFEKAHPITKAKLACQ
ncbi:MAG: Asp-tRNA(Asn)/Glu-tRNA(Gln) amidotransferase subunit GatA [Deltaproteobacteria bacterium]|nr:Asp-tRNA(Asn)/Glu-tRNA(Gln) amidotransferase subunit GatA [Deltaproteobacteria bacterium]